MKREEMTHNEMEQDAFSELNPSLKDALDSLKDVPVRSVSHTEAGKQQFLQSARTMRPAVSPADKRRHRDKGTHRRVPMKQILARVLIAAAIAVGGAGMTATAAQASTPNDVLYPVKTFTEDVRLALTSNPDAEFNYLLELVDRRMSEMEALLGEGETIPTQVASRLETHLQQALQQAAQMDDPTMLQAMNQVQTMVQTQLQTMQEMHVRNQINVNEDALHHAEEAMNRIHAATEDAIQDPTAFRNQMESSQPGNGNGDQTYPGNGQGGPGEGGNGSDTEPCEGEDCPLDSTQGTGQSGRGRRWWEQ